jgi:hypothetical protein
MKIVQIKVQVLVKGKIILRLQKWVGFIEKNLLLKNKLARMAQIYKKNS